jgi:hypothetical protein
VGQSFHGIGQFGDHGTVDKFLGAETERLVSGHIASLDLSSRHPATPA